MTPPLNGLILPGITRKSLLELAKNWVREQINIYFDDNDDENGHIHVLNDTTFN